MKTEIKIEKLSKIKPNPENPRLIKDDSFERLKKSIQDFPEMLELREVIVDENMVILGGNQRYKALKDLGIKETQIKIVSGLTEEQKKEFIIKDNVNVGDWDYEILADKWDKTELGEWGLDLMPEYIPVNNEKEIEEIETTNECPSCGYKW